MRNIQAKMMDQLNKVKQKCFNEIEGNYRHQIRMNFIQYVD